MTKRSMTVVMMAAAVALFAHTGRADSELKAASLFQDNLVLQQGQPVPMWGQAAAGQMVRVSIGERHAETKADSNGCWKVALKSLRASAVPQSLTIASGTNTLTLANVLVGEVWICSGQSNMEFPVGGVQNVAAETAQATNTAIRMFTVGKGPTPFPQRACAGSWQVCSPQTVGGFSAVGYFFARSLYQEMNVPVGMINASWGGTAAEPWTTIEALRELPFMKERLVSYEKAVADYTANKATYDQKRAAAQQVYETAKAAWTKQLADSDAGTKEQWAAPATKLEGWNEFTVPMLWEHNVLNSFIGVVWARKDVELPEAWLGKDLILHLGPIDDQDITYFNGTQVGSSPVEMWNTPRQYKIPAALNTSRKATIAVRIMNQLGAIGMYGDEKNYWLKPDGVPDAQPLVIAGNWPYRNGLAIDLKTMPQPPPAGIPGMTPGEPATLFNSMIAPLAPYALRGAIWYQGESNSGQPVEYQSLLPAMIGSWRRTWGQGDFPFGIVQLANFMARQTAPIEPQSWADLRDAQSATLATPHTGLAVTIDIGNASDIHPKNKQDVGRRLALWALAKVYGKDGLYSGPVFRELKVSGSQAALRFDQVGGGLVAKGQPLVGFAIAGTNKVFHVAQARIDGRKVLVSANTVPHPVAVRYAWANNPICNLYNAEGLPASPFRSDTWARDAVKSADGETLSEPLPAP